MRQASLKLKSYVGGVNIVNNNNLERRILNTMLVSLGALALSYVLLMGSVVWNIVERKSLEARALSLSNEVADLELSYFSVINTVDVDLGLSLGFKEQEATFATRKSLGKVSTTGNTNTTLNSKRNEI